MPFRGDEEGFDLHMKHLRLVGLRSRFFFYVRYPEETLHELRNQGEDREKGKEAALIGRRNRENGKERRESVFQRIPVCRGASLFPGHFDRDVRFLFLGGRRRNVERNRRKRRRTPLSSPLSSRLPHGRPLAHCLPVLFFPSQSQRNCCINVFPRVRRRQRGGRDVRTQCRGRFSKPITQERGGPVPNREEEPISIQDPKQTLQTVEAQKKER
mmetsp:Transcript_11556/g.30766  ORF Transcript_11556/g.30766 Transcript_11556/m.30766 type:complete len:213 (-) Transcript_11556:7049-7687(-)